MVPSLRGSCFGKYASDDAHADAGGSVRVAAHQRQIAQRGGHQDVGAAAASHQIARDVLAVARIMPRLHHAQHVLRRRGFVQRVARIDVGAVFQQVLRDLHVEAKCSGVWPLAPRAPTAPGSAANSSRSFSSMPRRAAACASTAAPRSMRNAAISGEHSSRTPTPPAHQWLRALMSAPARSSTSMVLPVAPLHGRKHRLHAGAVIGQRFVDLRFQLGVVFEHVRPLVRRRSHARRLPAFPPVRSTRARVSTCSFSFDQRGKSVFAGDHVLRVREFQTRRA